MRIAGDIVLKRKFLVLDRTGVISKKPTRKLEIFNPKTHELLEEA